MALGIFKPVVMEFDNIPYKVLEYKPEEYIENYDAYLQAMTSLNSEEIRVLEETNSSTQVIEDSEIDQVVDILNSNN